MGVRELSRPKRWDSAMNCASGTFPVSTLALYAFLTSMSSNWSNVRKGIVGHAKFIALIEERRAA